MPVRKIKVSVCCGMNSSHDGCRGTGLLTRESGRPGQIGDGSGEPSHGWERIRSESWQRPSGQAPGCFWETLAPKTARNGRPTPARRQACLYVAGTTAEWSGPQTVRPVHILGTTWAGSGRPSAPSPLDSRVFDLEGHRRTRVASRTFSGERRPQLCRGFQARAMGRGKPLDVE